MDWVGRLYDRERNTPVDNKGAAHCVGCLRRELYPRLAFHDSMAAKHTTVSFVHPWHRKRD